MRPADPVLRYGGYVFSVGGARAAGILISSLTFPYLVRRLGVELYGLWSYVVVVSGFMNLVADPGITTHATQQIAARRERGFELMTDVLFLRAASSSIALLILLGIAAFEVRSDVRQLLRLYGTGILFVSLLSADGFLSALEMFHARSLLALIQQGLYAVGIFALVRSPKDVIWVPVSILVSSALSGLAGWTLMWRRGFKLTGSIRVERWKGILVPSVHYAASSLMSSVYHRTGHLLVRWFLGDFPLGLYAAAVRLVDILRGFIIIVLQVLMPRMALSATSGGGIRRLARLALAAVAVVSIPLAAGLIGTAHLVVPWVLGAKYGADVGLLRWVALYVITASAASLLSGTILFALGRHRAYLISTASGALAGVLLYGTLIPLLGLTGAGLAFVLAELVVAVAAYLQLPELRGLWRNQLAGIAMACALLMLAAVRIVNAYTQRAFFVIATGAVVYLVSCGWFVRKLLIEEVKSAQPVA